jgi:phosphoribosylcarboxyaminoimidazole (NCAIR) mutase
MNPLVGIIMGSESDLEIMKGAAEMLRQFEVEPGINHRISSSHTRNVCVIMPLKQKKED